MYSCCVELTEHIMTLLKFIWMTYMVIYSKGDKCKYNQHCSECDRSTGHCLTDCDPGYFDQICSSECSRNCRNHSCQLSSSGIGACTKGCVPGYQGPGCSIRCDSPGGTCAPCPGGCDGGYCQLGSSCVSGCVDSCYGTDCKTCTSRCKSCNRMTGLCKECHPGYFGPNCAYSCDHCLGSCEHGCSEGCLPGFYGTFCEEKCSEKCGPDPNISTSKPLQALNAAFRHCHRASGDCIHGCARGFYGGLCQHTCEVCLDGVCDQTSGTCTMGCHLTGQTCDSTCTFNCSIAECRRLEYCNKEDNSVIQIAILSTALLVLVVGSILSVRICCRKRVAMMRERPQERELKFRQGPQSGEMDAPETRQESEQAYHDIYMNETGPVIVYL